MRIIILLIAMAILSSCASKKIMKNCEPRQAPFFDCEEV